MRYCVRCTFAGYPNVADGPFLEALATAGLLRTVEGGANLTLELLPPGGVSEANTGYWAGVTAERLAPLMDWTVEAVPAGNTEAN